MSLGTAYVFEGVSDRTRERIAAIAVEETHPEGDVLFRSGDPAQHLFILEQGRVRLSVLRGGMLSHIVSDPGEPIGWSSMAGNGTYTGSAVCSGPARMFRLDRDDLLRILEADPASGMAFFRRLAEVIGRRLVESYGATLSLNTQGDPHSYG